MTDGCTILMLLGVAAVVGWIFYRDAMRDCDGIRRFQIDLTRAQCAYDFQLERQPVGREDQP